MQCVGGGAAGGGGMVYLHALHEGQLFVFLLQLVDEEDFMYFGRLVQRLAPDLLEMCITQLSFACLLLLQLLLTGQLALQLHVLNCLQLRYMQMVCVLLQHSHARSEAVPSHTAENSRYTMDCGNWPAVTVNVFCLITAPLATLGGSCHSCIRFMHDHYSKIS